MLNEMDVTRYALPYFFSSFLALSIFVPRVRNTSSETFGGTENTFHKPVSRPHFSVILSGSVFVHRGVLVLFRRRSARGSSRRGRRARRARRRWAPWGARNGASAGRPRCRSGPGAAGGTRTRPPGGRGTAPSDPPWCVAPSSGDWRARGARRDARPTCARRRSRATRSARRSARTPRRTSRGTPSRAAVRGARGASRDDD